MHLVASSSRSKALGSWKLACLVPGTPDEQLEFFLSNGTEDEKLLKVQRGGGDCLVWVSWGRGAFLSNGTEGEKLPKVGGGGTFLSNNEEGEKLFKVALIIIIMCVCVCVCVHAFREV